MTNTPILFDNLIRFENTPSYEHFDHRAENLSSISYHLQKTFILADHYQKQIRVFNNNPTLKNILDETDNGEFISEHKLTEKIPTSDQALLTHIFLIINDYILTRKDESSNVFYFSFSIPMTNRLNCTRMIEFKVLPYIYTDATTTKLPWITYFQCSESSSPNPGRLTLHNLKDKSETFYLLNKETDHFPNFITLKKSDLEIFGLACQGFSESEIADSLSISIGALKRIKSSIMMYLNTQSTAQTITLLYQQGLI
jgi:Response regulator containing a CheY-like receiver domain and an HTH DNA-binding domain